MHFFYETFVFSFKIYGILLYDFCIFFHDFSILFHNFSIPLNSTRSFPFEKKPHLFVPPKSLNLALLITGEKRIRYINTTNKNNNNTNSNSIKSQLFNWSRVRSTSESASDHIYSSELNEIIQNERAGLQAD